MGKNKRSRSYYIQSAKKQKGAVLGPDMVGYMCTCNFYERDCVREAYNVLNEFADELYGKEFPEKEDVQISEVDKEEKSLDNSENVKSTSAANDTDDDDDDDDDPLDMEAAIKADVSELKKNTQEDKKKTRRFNQVHCGAKSCVFIQTTLEDPLPLSLAIMDELLLSQKQRTKKLLRMIPVHATCKAYPEDIKKAVKELASVYFKENSKSYCVVFKVRNNTSIKKEDMVFDLAAILHNANSKNRPDLTSPDVVLNVDVIKNVCCLSMLPHYFTKYSKYNLVLLANKNTSPPSEDGAGKDEKVTLESSAKKDECVTLEENGNKGENVTLDSSVDKGEKEIAESSVDKGEKEIAVPSVDKSEKVIIESNAENGKGPLDSKDLEKV